METYKPHIGKNVIETLTLGMYDNPLFIYREYIQNAADQIDVAVEEGILDQNNSGRIDILVDKENKFISIEDNATGIKSNDVIKFLGDIANSRKDRTKRKGFRGIGRLGGLGYCEKLVFETSYIGEATKNIISFDAKLLKKIIEDVSVVIDASSVISVITLRQQQKEDIDKHYFKVILLNVTNNSLLDEINVKNYISMVAPLPFNEDFIFSKKIHEFLNKNNIKIDEYNIRFKLNNEKLFKAYKMNLLNMKGFTVSVIDVDFVKLIDNNNELIALGWYGITDLLNNVIHKDEIERGIRIRKENIQIGNEDSLNTFFKEDRFNHHFIGEIYVIGDAFTPNARRDYFNDNKTVKFFRTKLEDIFKNLLDLSHRSSEVHSGISKILKYKEEKKNFNDGHIDNQYELDQRVKALITSKKNAIKGQSDILKSLEKAGTNEMISEATRLIFKFKKKNKDLTINDNGDNLEIDLYTYEQPTMSKLNNMETNLVLEIFGIIEETIQDPKIVIALKRKIIDHYN